MPPTAWGTPTFSDDFSGAEVDTGSWYLQDDKLRARDQVHVANGELQLVGEINSQGRDIGAGVITEHHLSLTYGRYATKVRFGVGAGYAPAILLWPRSGTWADGEIDLIEAWAPSRQWALNWAHLGAPDHKLSHTVSADFTKWHTIAVDWEPSQITYWLDDTVQWIMTTPDLIPVKPMDFALQIIKSCYPACRNSQTPPQVVMHVDWVKIYAAA